MQINIRVLERNSFLNLTKSFYNINSEMEAMQDDGVDALDAYMSAIKSGAMDTKTKMKLKRQLLELKKEEQKLQKIINVAKPAAMPELKRHTYSHSCLKYFMINSRQLHSNMFGTTLRHFIILNNLYTRCRAFCLMIESTLCLSSFLQF